MALPTSGPLSLQQIRTEFGGPTPISLLNYYRGGLYVPNTAANAGIPTSGPLSIQHFYGGTAVSTQLLTGLVSYWEFEGNLVDRTGNNTFSGVPPANCFVPGKQGTALLANGFDLNVAKGTAVSVANRVTMGMWLYRTGTKSMFNLYMSGPYINDTVTTFRYGFVPSQFNSTTRFFIVHNNSPTYSRTYTPALAFSANTWYFVVAWFDGNNLHLQVNNGTPQSVATPATTIAVNHTQLALIFQDGVTVDQAFMYNRVLSADERSALYNGGLGRSYASLP